MTKSQLIRAIKRALTPEEDKIKDADDNIDPVKAQEELAKALAQAIINYVDDPEGA